MEMNRGYDKKRRSKSRIAGYILSRKETSKQEIAAALGMSMPTVLTNVRELVEAGIVEETGAYESTGGRKAKALSIAAGIRYAVGVDITANHISCVLLDARGELQAQRRTRCVYEPVLSYYDAVRRNVESLLAEAAVDRKRILGVGISLPGIIDKNSRTLVKSHILQVENISLHTMSEFFQWETVYENDASSAAMAEFDHQSGNGVYLSLSNTVGGAIYLNRSIYPGENYRSAEFGHMIVEAEGELCYCGKRGCLDAYCSAKNLSAWVNDDLSAFFEQLSRGDVQAAAIWDRYLNYLAIGVSNLRMAFDCDIVLGGYVGAYLEPYRLELGQKVSQYNLFDRDFSYIKFCRYRREASAVGIAMTFVEKFIDGLG